jgi:hypothetical protein
MTIKENLLHSATQEVERIGREVTGRDTPHTGFSDGRWWLQGLLAIVEKMSRGEGGPPHAEKERTRRGQPFLLLNWKRNR